MDKLVKRLQDQEQHPVSEALVKRFATAQPPATLDNVNLHDYQLHGMRWMLTKYAQDLNPILGDEMGLGKTLQVIAFIASLLEYFESEDAPRKKNPDEAAMFLIVAPLSVLPNWIEQFERFAPSIDVVVYTGQKIERQATEEKVKARKAKPLVVVTSYEMVLFNADFFGGTTWKLLILDEGHRLKNAKGKLYEMLSTKLPVKHKVILSGTPIQNNLTELFSLLSFLNPTIFSNQQLFEATFKDYFSAKAQQLDPTKAATKSMHLLAAEDLMRDILTPLLLLRTIHDVNSSFTLPPISEMVVHTPLSPMQREFYKEIVAKNSDLINAVAANHASRVNLTNILPQLRKICNHPYLFPGTEPEPFCEGPHLYQNSGKLYVLQQILPCLKADGHCVLLFSQSTAFLDILQDFLTMEGFSYERIDGSVRGKERWQAIERFRHAPETFVFLISTRSGGVGLNLQRADTVIFADSDYNPQQDLQAVARAYRLGQTKPIHVIKFLCASTVEEIIYRRALKKMRMADKIRNCARQVDNEEDDLDNEASLVEMIQFGLHKLMEEPEGEELALTKPLDGEYITHILARRTVDAKVVVLEDGTVKNEKVTEAGGDFQEENMYYFEGEDHSAPDAKAKARDGDALKQLLSAAKISKRRRPNSLHERYVGEENDNYEEKEELDEATIAENEAEKARKREERRQKRLDKKLAMWKAHGYESTAIPIDDGGDDGSSPGVNFAATNQIRYKAGDASQPPLASIRSDAIIIVHCVDTSGVWSSRGFFRSLSALSPTIQQQYEAAARNDDLKLGQAHLIQLPSCSEGGRNVGMFVCLLVVQGYVETSGQGKKKKLRGGAPLVHHGKSTTFRMHALETSLHALARRAHALYASVHMPRIGYGTPHFNWYAVERIIQRQLRDAGVSSYNTDDTDKRPRSKRKKRKKRNKTEGELLAHAQETRDERKRRRARAALKSAGKETMKDRKARNRLFSSSESESDDSGGIDAPSPSDTAPTMTQRAFSMFGARSSSAKIPGTSSTALARNGGSDKTDHRRKTLASSSSFKGTSGASSSSSSSTLSGGRESANNSSFIGGSGFPERKGLFEQDDEPDSMENFHERVKIRQMKKQSEMETTKAELESALVKIADLEQRVAQELKEKVEYEIRMKECHRIIEKRNKQLMKASERVARYTEQAETQLTELQAKIAQLTTENEQLRAFNVKQQEALQKEMDAKILEYRKQFEVTVTEQKQAFDAKLERVTQASEESVLRKQSENDSLRLRIKELESEVMSMASRVTESEEYQTLLKKCEDTEAISRGLKFQLEKDQQEKKFLKSQLAVFQASAGFSETVDAQDDQPSPTSSVTSGPDLSSFDFTRQSMLESPVHRLAPKSPTQKRAEGFSSKVESTDDKVEETNKSFNVKKAPLNEKESMTTTYRTSKPKEEQPPVVAEPPPAPMEEKPMARAGSASTTFFEKLSIKFKRSSPRSSFNTKADKVEESAAASTAPTIPPTVPSASLVSDASAAPAATGRKQRPKMYVAKAPSNYDEESSDSIFGDDSDSEDSSFGESDDESPPLPPPPPEMPGPARPAPAAFATQPSLFGPHQVVPSDDSDDADFSSSSDSEDEKPAAPTPTMPSSKSNESSLSFRDQPATKAEPASRNGQSSSDSSLSSDDSDDEKQDSDAKKDVNESKRKRTKERTRESKSDVSSNESSSSSESDKRDVNRHRRRRDTEEDNHKKQSRRGSSVPRPREKSHSTGDEMGNLAHTTSKSRMNEYMEARAKKRLEKLKKKEEKENAEHKKKEEYEKEWEKMAQEERERKRKQQQARRSGRRRPSSLKTVRVSQMRQQMNKQQQQKDPQQDPFSVARPDDAADGEERQERRRQSSRRKSNSKVSESDEDADEPTPKTPTAAQPAEPTPLPPEPTEADTELYLRQQARLRERHELEMKRKMDADEADLVRGQIHRRVEMWAFGKELLHMILTLDQISANEALQKCQLSVIQSPDNETVRKAYRNIIRVIHPDKLRGATVPEQLEAQELFTVLNQAFEKFKTQAN